MLHLCEDESVLGTAFFVMEFVDGTVFWDPALPELEKAQRTKVYDEENRALAALHLGRSRPRSASPTSARPGSYFARQRDRWTKQYRASETEHLEDMETLIAWLEKNEPPDDGRCQLVHGDYRLDNMIFAHDGSRLLAVIDWELSTWATRSRTWPTNACSGAFPTTRPCAGWPASTARRSASRRRRSTSPSTASASGISGIPIWKFCLAFSFFRLAAIVQGVKKRGLDGNASNPEKAIKSGERVPLMAKMGVEAIEAG
jgi:aminoglycoside phosphotransferase (APT) family kinase protein